MARTLTTLALSVGLLAALPSTAAADPVRILVRSPEESPISAPTLLDDGGVAWTEWRGGGAVVVRRGADGTERVAAGIDRPESDWDRLTLSGPSVSPAMVAWAQYDLGGTKYESWTRNQRLVLVDANGDPRVLASGEDVPAGCVARQAGFPPWPYEWAFSLDGRRLAWWDTRCNGPIHLEAPDAGGSHALEMPSDFMLDSAELRWPYLRLSGRVEHTAEPTANEVRVLDLRNDVERSRLHATQRLAGKRWDAVVDSTGTVLVFGDGGIWWRTLDDDRLRTVTDEPPGKEGCCTPYGVRLAAAHVAFARTMQQYGPSEIVALRLDGSSRTTRRPGPGEAFYEPDFDGRRLLWLTVRCGNYELWLDDTARASAEWSSPRPPCPAFDNTARVTFDRRSGELALPLRCPVGCTGRVAAWFSFEKKRLGVARRSLAVRAGSTRGARFRLTSRQVRGLRRGRLSRHDTHVIVHVTTPDGERVVLERLWYGLHAAGH